MEQNEAFKPEAWAQASGAKTLNLDEMETLAEKYISKWEAYEAKKKIASEAHAEFLEVETTMIRALNEAQKTGYKANNGLFSVRVKASVKVPGTIGAKKMLFEYLGKLGEDVLLSMQSINSATLNSWYVKAKEEAGDPPGFAIPGITESSSHTTLAFKAAKKGK